MLVQALLSFFCFAVGAADLEMFRFAVRQTDVRQEVHLNMNCVPCTAEVSDPCHQHNHGLEAAPVQLGCLPLPEGHANPNQKHFGLKVNSHRGKLGPKYHQFVLTPTYSQPIWHQDQG